MTPSAIFHDNDRVGALAFISEHPFGTIVVNGKRGPVTAQIPVALNETNDFLLGHVARANSFWEAARNQSCPAVAIFRGPDAYITPSSYLSKKEHGKVVPTWNYLAVEVRGEIFVETDSASMLPFIEILTQKMESHRELPWQVTDAPEEYIAVLSRGIVGIKLRLDEFTYVRKLSQDKSIADKNGVVADLKSSKSHLDRLVAKEMEKE